MPRSKRRICFVTGTRAEFGLMRSTLLAIKKHRDLQLQIVATGMHLDRRHGKTIDAIRSDGWKIDATVPWNGSLATATGNAIVALDKTFKSLRSEIILIVGDRVEAFAAATAGHLSGRIVAHIHGGDRALGQVDDALRHAITKLSHLHFPATKQSAARIAQLGEDRWRIHTVGAPGIDGIVQSADVSNLSSRSFALLVLHPTDADETIEYRRAAMVLKSLRKVGLSNIVIVHPNNDPGSRGIAQCWDEHANKSGVQAHRDVERSRFLGLMRDAAVMVGNSSSGIIEAASFGTPVIDIGPRQQGRERSENVTNVPWKQSAIVGALNTLRKRKYLRLTGRNVYGGNGTGVKIANVLSSVPLDDRMRRKLITY
jgi:UDP-N-acetylglucosamine 2-epimerase (non-hydrolysing)/GDP/UDP-N,N'-diacetylbacillosamine 2-epimerase (hydrolysing)